VNDLKKDGRIIENVFSTRSKKTHDALRKTHHRLYTLTHVLAYEPQVNQMVEYFTRKLGEYCDGRTLDLGQMLLYCNPF
jgi:hypothetical protein